MIRLTATTAFLLVACSGEAPPAPALTPGISQVADTTFVTTAEPGLDGVVTLAERWQQTADAERFGEITTAVLGATGTVWFAVTGGSDRAAVYRADREAPLRAIAQQGTTDGAFTGPLLLAALADGGVVAVERTSGRAVRFDSLGVATDTLVLAPLPDDRPLVPDRHGGWFAPFATGGAWLHHDPRGGVTDTLRPAVGWIDAAATSLARDGSWLRAVAGGTQVARRAGSGPTLTGRWIGAPLDGVLRVAHDAEGLVWVHAAAKDGSTRSRSFDRDARLRFVIDVPSGMTVLDQDGEYLLLRSAEGALRVMEVVSGSS
jgi:hypothetical protein